MTKNEKIEAVTQAEASHSEQRISGALECIKALARLEQSAENLPDEANDPSVYYGIQSGDAKAISDLFGPMTPRQEGAMRALGEYIHSIHTTGTPNLTRWHPVVSQTAFELQEHIDHVNTISAETVAA